MDVTPGILALVGGGEWQEGCYFDAELAGRRRDRTRSWSCPPPPPTSTPSAWWSGPAEWFAPLGGQVEGLMVLSRADADRRRRRRRSCAGPGSSTWPAARPMHLRSVLKHSAVWDALVAAWDGGAVVVGSSGAAMALTDPMVDARGGGLTIGLGLVTGRGRGSPLRRRPRGRARREAPPLGAAGPAGTPVAGIPERTALIRDPDGTWRSAGRRAGGGVPGRGPAPTAWRPAGLTRLTAAVGRPAGRSRSVGLGDGHRLDDHLLGRGARAAAHRLDGLDHVEAA